MSDMIKPIARDILRDSAVIEQQSVRLTCGQLDRKSYQAVNEVLERAGGKWNRKLQVHVFADVDATEVVQSIIHTGVLPPKNPLDFFPTPPAVVVRMLEKAWIEDGDRILEPSAGEGAICDMVVAAHPHTFMSIVEIDLKRAERLLAKGYVVHQQDFLQFQTLKPFDAILMNPPFTAHGDPLAYITHIEHALTMLVAGRRLVAIAPGGFAYRTDRRVAEFRSQVEQRGGWRLLEKGSFKASGTDIQTVMLWMDA